MIDERDIDFFNPKLDNFFSIVIPSYVPGPPGHAERRLGYLKRCIDSIHRFADMPFEIIVHNDSGKPLASEIKDKVSIVGLAESANRAISLASSNNILFLNDDIVMRTRCLKRFKLMLERPYVGMIGPYGEPPEYPKSGEYVLRYKGTGPLGPECTDFFVTFGVGGCAVMVFRKDFWRKTGGFARVDSGRSDTVVAFKAWLNGYFRARVFGMMPFQNMSLVEQNNSDTTLGPYQELHLPTLFKVPPNEYEKMNHKRATGWKRFGKIEEYKEEGLANLQYWHNFTQTIVPDRNPCNINWENARKYNQIQWKGELLADAYQIQPQDEEYYNLMKKYEVEK